MKKNKLTKLIIILLITILLFSGCMVPSSTSTLKIRNKFIPKEEIELKVRTTRSGPKGGGFGYTTKFSVSEIVDKYKKKYPSANVVELSSDAYVVTFDKTQFLFWQSSPKSKKAPYYGMVISCLVFNMVKVDVSTGAKESFGEIYFPIYMLENYTEIEDILINKEMQINVEPSKFIEFYNDSKLYDVTTKDNGIEIKLIKTAFTTANSRVPLLLTFKEIDNVTTVTLTID